MRLVLDLDDTLILSAVRRPPIGVDFFLTETPTIRQLYVLKRPHLAAFLQQVSQFCEVIIFTAAVQSYADPIIDRIEQNAHVNFSGRFYQQHCSTDKEGQSFKDLNTIPGHDPTNTIIIDNNP